MPETVAVVGAGVAGLAAAWELTGGAGGPGPGTPEVVVLEASARVGGRVASVAFAGGPVDVGPDGFLGRRPEATTLCRELGLAAELEPIGTSGAAVWVGGHRRILPAGLVLGVPTRLLPAARSGVLGPGGSLRLLADVVAPRRDVRGPLGDRAVGPLVARRLGRRVVERLVDPLVGGIHAGGVADMSAAAVFPLLLAVAPRRGSFMRALRRASAAEARDAGGVVPGGAGSGVGGSSAGSGGLGGLGRSGGAGSTAEPAFWTLRGGTGSLPDRLVAALAGRGVVVQAGRPVGRLSREEPGRWRLDTPAGPLAADGLVLAVPAPQAAGLLAPLDPEAAALLRGIDHASVAVVTLAYPREGFPTDLLGTGLLVPRGSPAPAGLDGDLVVTACTYLDAKWPHLARPGVRLVRASAGRYGDDRAPTMDDGELVARISAEVQGLLGVARPPVEVAVTRWPDAFPQYRVHHLLRVAGIEAAVRRLPAVALAGAAYRGVGLPACVGSGRAAARAVLEALARGAGGAPLP